MGLRSVGGIALVCSAALAGALFCGVAGAASPTWSVVPSPNSTTAQNQLNSVSCTSTSFCMAVGGSSATGVPLTEEWNGSSWAVLSAPATTEALYGVSCFSDTGCFAVGWSVSPLAAVIDEWDGSAWNEVDSFEEVALAGVSCTSSTFCTAVGTNGEESVVDQWDGSAWTSQTLSGSGYNQLASVSCATATSCVAVGITGSISCNPPFNCSFEPGSPMAESWNGTSWTQFTPNRGKGTFDSVSCATTELCVAVGTKNKEKCHHHTCETEPVDAIADVWNGTGWSVTKTRTARGTQLFDVSCSTVAACTAVGSDADATLIEDWNGRNWSQEPSPTIAGVTGATLSGVSCAATTDCTAVGWTYSSAYSTLVESTNGS